jgi:ribose transport system permease protein
MAVGGNEAAAHLSGIPIVRVKVATYLACGALAGLAAVCHTAQSRLGDPEAGQMFELKAIAAVVIGGTALSGGRGGVLPTVVGVLTIGYIEKILSINGVREHWRLIVQGAIIVGAVLLQRRR